MPLLAANRRVLATRAPEILELLDTAVPTTAPFHPPREEPAAFIEEAVASHRILLVLTGLPARATAETLRTRAPRETIFWCLESSASLLAARLATEDCSAWLSDERMFLSVGVPSATALRRLNREFAWVDSARALCLPSRHSGADALWRPLLVATLARLRQRWMDILTDLRMAPVHWENTCANLPAFLAAPGIETLAGAFAGTSLVLVAAGPSLDDALPFLKRIADRALIVTGNTSFRALAAHGLAPHLTVTVDPYATTDLGYAGQVVEDTHLVSSVFAYPSVHQRFAGRLFGLADHSILLARLRTAAGLPPPPPLLGEGTVSATMIKLAVYLGCDRVIFVGQDFAIADDGRTHASDTIYTDLGANRQADDQVHRLAGTTRPQVTVPTRHLWYLRNVEHLIAQIPQICFLNTSHRGASIAGTTFTSYDEAAAAIASAPQRDFAAELRARHAAAPFPSVQAAMMAELDRIRTTVGEALRLSLAAALTAELALADNGPAAQHRFDIETQRFEQWRQARPSDQPLLFEGCTKPEIFAAEKRRVILPATDPATPLREAGELAWAYTEGAASVFRGLSAIGLPST